MYMPRLQGRRNEASEEKGVWELYDASVKGSEEMKGRAERAIRNEGEGIKRE